MGRHLGMGCQRKERWRFTLCIVKHWIKGLSELVALGFLGSSAGEESTCKGRRPWFDSWVPPVFLPGESPWTEEPGGLKSMGSQRVGHH